MAFTRSGILEAAAAVRPLVSSSRRGGRTEQSRDAPRGQTKLDDPSDALTGRHLDVERRPWLSRLEQAQERAARQPREEHGSP